MSNAVLLPLWGEPVRRHQTLEAASRGPGEVQQGRARDLEDRSSLSHGKVVYGYVYIQSTRQYSVMIIVSETIYRRYLFEGC